MSRILFYFPALLFFFSFSQLNAQNFQEQAVDSLFMEWNGENVPGAVVGIIREGKMVYARGYGSGDMEHHIPLSPSSVFYIGSVSKQFVTMCILLLEEEGKLSLNDPITTYLRDFPGYGKEITISHLIHHTSGLKDLFLIFEEEGLDYLNAIDKKTAYELIRNQDSLNFLPGERHSYSNSCYFLLGEIIGMVSGTGLKEYAAVNIFDPLGMKNSHFHDDETHLIPNKVFSYRYNEEQGRYENIIMKWDLVGSGGLYTSLEDLFLWDQNFYDNKLGDRSAALIEKMHDEGFLNNGEPTGYGFALVNGEYRGLRTVEHLGSLAGYRSDLLRFPEQELSIIILANREDAQPEALARKVADIVLKDFPRKKTGNHR